MPKDLRPITRFYIYGTPDFEQRGWIYFQGNAQQSGNVTQLPLQNPVAVLAGTNVELFAANANTPEHTPVMLNSALTPVLFAGWSLAPAVNQILAAAHLIPL